MEDESTKIPEGYWHTACHMTKTSLKSNDDGAEYLTKMYCAHFQLVALSISATGEATEIVSPDMYIYYSGIVIFMLKAV